MLIKPITVLTDEVDKLIQQSRRYQETLYPQESINQDDPHSLVYGNMYFIGAYDGDELCGLGGVKIMNDNLRYGEIKNLFVSPEFRGRGISKVIMNALEQFLINEKISICRLETGVSQPESIGLYHRLGYRDREAYGDYRPDPLCVFMEKKFE